MSYTIAESIERLSPFIEHPGIREIIERLKSIESNTDNEATISRLRRELNDILCDDQSKTIRKGDVSLDCEVHYALMAIAWCSPLNQEDPILRTTFTPEEIKNGDLICISTGQQLSLVPLAEWINKGPENERKAYSNPGTGAEFHLYDQEAIYEACRAKDIALISPAQAAARVKAEQTALAVWPEVAEVLKDALQSVDINARIGFALELAAGLEAGMRPVADHHQITVDSRELLARQADAWRVLLQVLEAANSDVAGLREIATVLVTATQKYVIKDPQALVERKIVVWQGIFALLIMLVQSRIVDDAVVDAVDVVDARTARKEVAILLKAAMQEAGKEGVDVNGRKIVAALEVAKQAIEQEAGKEGVDVNGREIAAALEVAKQAIEQEIAALEAAEQAIEQEAAALKVVEDLPTAWPEVVVLLTNALRGAGINDKDLEVALEFAVELEAIVRRADGYNRLTVSFKELAAWQFAVWRVLSAVYGLLNHRWEAAGVLVRTTKDFIANDEERARGREIITWRAVVTLLTGRVQKIVNGDSVADRKDLGEFTSLLDAALHGVFQRQIVIGARVLEAADEILETAEKITGREAPERDEQLLSVAPQSRFFRPESPRTTSEQNGCWPLSRRYWASEPSLALKNK